MIKRRSQRRVRNSGVHGDGVHRDGVHRDGVLRDWIQTSFQGDAFYPTQQTNGGSLWIEPVRSIEDRVLTKDYEH